MVDDISMLIANINIGNADPVPHSGQPLVGTHDAKQGYMYFFSMTYYNTLTW